jgi:hypothetical protein
MAKAKPGRGARRPAGGRGRARPKPAARKRSSASARTGAPRSSAGTGTRGRRRLPAARPAAKARATSKRAKSAREERAARGKAGTARARTGAGTAGPEKTAAERATKRAPAAASGRPARGTKRQAPTSTRAPRGNTAAATRKVTTRTREAEEHPVPTPPSSLDLDRRASAARSGHEELVEHLHEHTETGPRMTGGDIDASWENAYSSGEEAPGGDHPTPDQDIVEEIGRAIGIEYEDNEELKAAAKVEERDRHRWELDPASAEDYEERQRRG